MGKPGVDGLLSGLKAHDDNPSWVAPPDYLPGSKPKIKAGGHTHPL